MAQFTKVASTADLAPGAAKCVEVARKKLALFNVDGSCYAIDDTCTHLGGPLSEGEVSGEEVTCLWHGAVYNIKTTQPTRAARRCELPGPRAGIGRRGRGVSHRVLAGSCPGLSEGRWPRRDRSSEPKPIPRSARCVPTAARAFRPKSAILIRSMQKIVASGGKRGASSA